MKEVINRLNKIEEENLKLKSQVQKLIQEQEMCKNDNISQRMSLIESDIDVILRNNGKGNYFSGKKILRQHLFILLIC